MSGTGIGEREQVRLHSPTSGQQTFFFTRTLVLFHHISIQHSGQCCVLVFRGGISPFDPFILTLFFFFRSFSLPSIFLLSLSQYHSIFRHSAASLSVFFSQYPSLEHSFRLHTTDRLTMCSFVNFRGFLWIPKNVVRIWLNTSSMNYAKKTAACNRNDEREIQATIATAVRTSTCSKPIRRIKTETKSVWHRLFIACLFSIFLFLIL